MAVLLVLVGFVSGRMLSAQTLAAQRLTRLHGNVLDGCQWAAARRHLRNRAGC